MVLERLRAIVDIDRVGRFVPLHPNIITILSAAVAWGGVPSVWLYGVPPLIFIIVSSVLDGIDGAVARARGLATKKGAFLDSFLDRLSDAAYLLYFWHHAESLVIYTALIGTFSISYVRCRAESLGIEARGVGFMERGERVLYLIAAAVLECIYPNILPQVLLLYTVLVNVAAIHRGILLFRRLK
ncbi:MAG: CDP-alcohol phosphatidyltransferase family protein [Pyrobaculum sp.]